MRNLFKILQPFFILSIPFLIFFKPENFIEMIGNEIFYLSILLLSLYILSIILSFFILKVFSKKLKNLTSNNIIFIFGIIFFEIFYHEKIRDLIVNNSNLDTINAFILSLIIIFFINFLTIIILIKYFHKIKINIFIFMVLLVIVTHLNNFNLYKSKIQNDEELTFFKKSELPKKKLNEKYLSDNFRRND